MTLTRLELLKPLEPGLIEVIISVSMQVSKDITDIFLIAEHTIFMVKYCPEIREWIVFQLIFWP